MTRLATGGPSVRDRLSRLLLSVRLSGPAPRLSCRRGDRRAGQTAEWRSSGELCRPAGRTEAAAVSRRRFRRARSRRRPRAAAQLGRRPQARLAARRRPRKSPGRRPVSSTGRPAAPVNPSERAAGRVYHRRFLGAASPASGRSAAPGRLQSVSPGRREIVSPARPRQPPSSCGP